MTTTGRIVAMASYPDYNPNVWTNGISESEFNALFGAQEARRPSTGPPRASTRPVPPGR